MGLDMYLDRNTFIGGQFEHRKVSGTISIKINGELIKIKASSLSDVNERVGYWRKANQIHNWFVKNVQNGVDECQRSYVSIEQLRELYTEVCKVLDTKDTKSLPPTSGFFFGSTNIDEGYWYDLENTKTILEKVISEDEKNPTRYSYYYHASW